MASTGPRIAGGGPELQVLPAVIDVENAHDGDRGVDGAVEIAPLCAEPKRERVLP
jgi:hypothetical protein